MSFQLSWSTTIGPWLIPSLELLFTDAMAMLLDLWSALLLGILYLTFQAFPIIFGKEHHFSLELTGLTFIGIGVGLSFGLLAQPLVNRYVDTRLLCEMLVTHRSL